MSSGYTEENVKVLPYNYELSLFGLMLFNILNNPRLIYYKALSSEGERGKIYINHLVFESLKGTVLV